MYRIKQCSVAFSHRLLDVDHDRLIMLMSALPSSSLYKPDLKRTSSSTVHLLAFWQKHLFRLQTQRANVRKSPEDLSILLLDWLQRWARAGALA
jgi:hypothetical protein